MALDVLDDAEQQRRTFFRIRFALSFQKAFQNLMRGIAALQSHLARLLEQRNPQSSLANSVEWQRQKDAIEHLIWVADHRLVILLLTHDGCKVTSYF